MASRIQGESEANNILESDSILENLKVIYGETDFGVFSLRNFMTSLKGYEGKTKLHVFN
jgi:hypothetical protein